MRVRVELCELPLNKQDAFLIQLMDVSDLFVKIVGGRAEYRYFRAYLKTVVDW